MASTARLKFAHSTQGSQVWAYLLNRMLGAERNSFEPFRCAQCNVPLSFVSSGFRGDGEERVKVHAHFRLKPGGTHLPDCPMTAQGVIDRHFRPNRKSNGSPVIALDPIWAGAADEDSFNDVVQDTLDLAEKLIDLDPATAEVDRLVRFELGGKVVRWKNLCFPHGRYSELVGGVTPKTPTLKGAHPVIIAGEIKSARPVRGGVRILLVAEVGKIDGERVFIRPAFRISQKWQDRFTVGASVLLVGLHEVNYEASPSRSRDSTVWVNLSVQRLRQIRILAEDPTRSSDPENLDAPIPPDPESDSSDFPAPSTPIEALPEAVHEYVRAHATGNHAERKRLAAEIRAILEEMERD